MIPSLGSINLLEQLTELRETFYLLDYQFIIKGCNSGTARWKRARHRARHGERAQSSRHQHKFTSLETLQSSPFGVLRWLHSISMVD